METQLPTERTPVGRERTGRVVQVLFQSGTGGDCTT